jgi:hypothetical protein
LFWKDLRVSLGKTGLVDVQRRSPTLVAVVRNGWGEEVGVVALRPVEAGLLVLVTVLWVVLRRLCCETVMSLGGLRSGHVTLDCLFVGYVCWKGKYLRVV